MIKGYNSFRTEQEITEEFGRFPKLRSNREKDKLFLGVRDKIPYICDRCEKEYTIEWKAFSRNIQSLHFCTSCSNTNREHSEITRKKSSERFKERFRSDPEWGKKVTDARVKAMTGRKLSEETKKKISESHKGKKREKFSVQWREKLSISCSKSMVNKCAHNGYKTGYFKSNKNEKEMWYRSSYELKAMEILEENKFVLNYKSEVIRIPYFWDEINRNYVVDLLVTMADNRQLLIEIKPEIILKKCDKTKAKITALINYSKENKIPYEIWTEKNLHL